MTRYLLTAVAAVASIGLVLGTVGCESATTPSGSQSAEPKDDHGKMTEEQKEIEAALAKLSPADRKLAEQQKLCPVTEKPLGSMGKPVKLTVKGKEVFLCCPACEDAIRKEPEKYLPKLGE